jgi:hypothetical protein
VTYPMAPITSASSAGWKTETKPSASMP